MAFPPPLLIATGNPNKLREIRHLLADVPFRLLGLSDLSPVPEPDETGMTFQQNARLKALYYEGALAPHASHLPSLMTVSEDSGLEIDALGGAPGIHSARFLGSDASYPERFTEIQRLLLERPTLARTARFVCALAVAHQRRIVFETRGTIEGEIAELPRGTGGFGYDPIFFYPPFGRTLAEVDEVDKLAVAHRGHAFRALARWLKTKNGEH